MPDLSAQLDEAEKLEAAQQADIAALGEAIAQHRATIASLMPEERAARKESRAAFLMAMAVKFKEVDIGAACLGRMAPIWFTVPGVDRGLLLRQPNAHLARPYVLWEQRQLRRLGELDQINPEKLTATAKVKAEAELRAAMTTLRAPFTAEESLVLKWCVGLPGSADTPETLTTVQTTWASQPIETQLDALRGLAPTYLRSAAETVATLERYLWLYLEQNSEDF